jgi:ABC-type Zn uptake system ZnuABC Zn-binding protein ZnuA
MSYARTTVALALGFLAAGLAASRVPAAEAEPGVLVLTSLPVTYSVAKALTAGTQVEVRNLPEGGRPMGAQQSYFSREAERLAETFARADAVITIGKLWQEDPLFVAARAANIRIVDIDASKPWSETLEGASIALVPEDDAPWSDERPPDDATRAPSVYFWLSPSNGARIADIVARDLMRLAPDEASRIEANLAAYRRALLELKREYEVKLAALADVSAYALTPDLVYLTTDMSIYVDGYFLKQDIRWTPEDTEAFAAYLSANGIKTVLHRWEPAAPILEAIEAGGARLVVLDTGDPGIVEDGRLVDGGYVRVLRANLETLYEALLEAN